MRTCWWLALSFDFLFYCEISIAIENTLLYRSGTYVFPSTKKASCHRLVIADTEKYTDTLITALDFYVGNFLLHIFPFSLHRTLNVEKALSFFEIPKLFLCFFPTNGHCFFCSIPNWNLSKLIFALKKTCIDNFLLKHRENIVRKIFFLEWTSITFLFLSSRFLTQKFLSSEQGDRQEREHEGRSKTSNNAAFCAISRCKSLRALTWKKTASVTSFVPSKSTQKTKNCSYCSSPCRISTGPLIPPPPFLGTLLKSPPQSPPAKFE